MVAATLAIVISSSHRRETAARLPAAVSSLASVHSYDSIRTNLDAYSWPTDAGRIVTSSFGEYRSTHFHAGIDISTGDQIGYRVFASRDGYIQRVRVDANGYGKVLYVRHADGYTTLYAHLSRFAPPIEERVRREQYTLERYQISIEFSPTDFPVKQGELIAYTGETGIGSPHLHFEIRDENMNAVNPFLCPAFQVADNFSPSFRKIAVIPLSPEGTVNGRFSALSMQLRQRRATAFSPTLPISITGAAGLAVYVRDRSDGSRYSRGVYRHRLFIDGKLFFEIRFDRVPTRESQQIGFYVVRDLLSMGEGRFEKLFVDVPSTIPFQFPAHVGAGTLDAAALGSGKHSFSIISQDFSGNSSEVTGDLAVAEITTISASLSGNTLAVRTTPGGSSEKLLVDGRNFSQESWQPLPVDASWDAIHRSAAIALSGDSPDIVRVRVAGLTGVISRPAFVVLHPLPVGNPSAQIESELTATGIEVILSSTGMFTSPPALAVEEGQVRRMFPMTAMDEHRYRTLVVPLDTVTGVRRLVFEGPVNGTSVRVVDNLEIFPIVAGRSGAITLDDGNLVIRYDSLSVYGSLYLQPKIAHAEGTRVYELLPEHAILRNGISLAMRSTDSRARQGLFTRLRGKWKLIGGPDKTTNRWFTARLTDWLGDVAIFSDTDPPVIGNVRLFPRGRRGPLATFRLFDELSGVDYNELKTYIDGKFVVPDIDGEHRRATVQANDRLTRGSHQLTIRLKDLLGNTSVIERRFIIP
jgi:hypothetical protein